MTTSPHRLQVSLLVVGALVFLLVLPARRGAAQDTPEGRRVEWLARSPLNELPAPEGSTAHSGGGGSNADFDEWKLKIETNLSPAQVLEHYRARLNERGWKLAAVAVYNSVAITSGRVATGAQQHAVVVAALSESDPQVVMFVLRLTKPDQP